MSLNKCYTLLESLGMVHPLRKPFVDRPEQVGQNAQQHVSVESVEEQQSLDLVQNDPDLDGGQAGLVGESQQPDHSDGAPDCESLQLGSGGLGTEQGVADHQDCQTGGGGRGRLQHEVGQLLGHCVGGVGLR